MKVITGRNIFEMSKQASNYIVNEYKLIMIHLLDNNIKLLITPIIDNDLWIAKRFYNFEYDKTFWKEKYVDFEYYDKMSYYKHYSVKYYKLASEGELLTQIKIMKILFDALTLSSKVFYSQEGKDKFISMMVSMNCISNGFDILSEENQLKIISEIQEAYSRSYDPIRKQKSTICQDIESFIIENTDICRNMIYRKFHLL